MKCNFSYKGSWYKAVVRWIFTGYRICTSGIPTSVDTLVGLFQGVYSIASQNLLYNYN